jgi:predicted transcriptional regulator
MEMQMQMQTLKQEAIDAISTMPEQVDIDEIMYRLYVIDKIRKGREAADRGEIISIDELKKEIELW